MYHADPADEGEPSGGFNYRYLRLLVLLSFVFFSCRHRGSHATVASHVIMRGASKPVTKEVAPVADTKPKKKKKKIYLTFDDGPNKGTRNVLDIVQQEDVPVTFFIVGQHV